MPKNISKIFLDTSVILTAYGSPEGGSALIIKHQGKRYRCLTSEDIVTGVLSKAAKFKTTEEKLKKWIVEKNILVTTSPDEAEKSMFAEVVKDSKDRHVLASTQKIRADILLSYDRKHILTPEIKKLLKPILVMTPKEFLQQKPV